MLKLQRSQHIVVYRFYIAPKLVIWHPDVTMPIVLFSSILPVVQLNDAHKKLASASIVGFRRKQIQTSGLDPPLLAPFLLLLYDQHPGQYPEIVY